MSKWSAAAVYCPEPKRYTFQTKYSYYIVLMTFIRKFSQLHASASVCSDLELGMERDEIRPGIFAARRYGSITNNINGNKLFSLCKQCVYV